jgi:hypothetical protein
MKAAILKSKLKALSPWAAPGSVRDSWLANSRPEDHLHARSVNQLPVMSWCVFSPHKPRVNKIQKQSLRVIFCG